MATMDSTAFIPRLEWIPISLPSLSAENLANRTALLSFKLASYLTDPVCKAHELYRRFCIADVWKGNSVSRTCRKVSLCAGLVGCLFAASVCSLPGILFRSLGAYLQTEPFIHVRGNGRAKLLPEDGIFTFLSWNICCVGAGYPISDGGVLPWSYRIDAIIEKILEKDADVNCLYETFDTQSAFILCEALKEKGYTHFYFNVGPKAVGVSSGIFVASKYDIQNAAFTPFPQSSLVGRTKNAAKGVFSFDLTSEKREFAKIFATHLQHSEEPAFPTTEEVEAREAQMRIILDTIDSVKNRCLVLTGDLNLDDAEKDASFWASRFTTENDFGKKDRTWKGDGFCARLTPGKKISGPLNLDHTLLLKGSNASIHTTLVETGFDPEIFQSDALSDHSGLLSTIQITSQ